jgi:hypothetical protein
MAFVTQVIDDIKAASSSLSDSQWGFCMLPVSCTLALPHVLNFKSSQTTGLEEAFAICSLRFSAGDPAGTCSDHFAFLPQYAKLTGCMFFSLWLQRLLPTAYNPCLFSWLLEIRARSLGVNPKFAIHSAVFQLRVPPHPPHFLAVTTD